MPVLVTGASGFLGGRLVQVLVSRGESVRVLARPHADLRHLVGLPIEVVAGSLMDPAALEKAARGASRIYNCAGCATDWAPWQTYFEANVAGVRNLLRAAEGCTGLERFLHVSTSDVYGYPRRPCDETAPVKDIGLPYNRSKILGEECVWEAARRTSLRVTVVRPATIYGPRGRAFGTDIARLLRSGLMAVMDGGRSRGGFCYIDNAVDAVILAATTRAAEGRVYNVADGTGVTWRGYVDALADGLGARRPWISIPAAIAFPMARAMEAGHRSLPFPGRPLLTLHAAYLLSRDQEYPIQKAQSELGFAPAIPFQEGLARTLEWLRREQDQERQEHPVGH